MGLTAARYEWEFDEAAEWLAQIDAPKVVVPGNHDSRNVGYVHFERLFGDRFSRYRRAFETERFLLVFDDRSGKEKLLLKDKTTEDLITIDAGVGIRIKTAKDVKVEVEGNVAVTAGGVEVFHLENGRVHHPPK